MLDRSTSLRLGHAIVTKIPECSLTLPAASLFPDWDPRAADADAGWLVPEHMDVARDTLTISVHSWLVRVDGLVVLVDTGIGRGKSRKSPLFDHRDEPFLVRLSAAGVDASEVTHVLLTHIHTDHVGWNTIRVGDRWVPTFPNARYLVPEVGIASFDSPEGRERPNYDMFADSVLPVLEAGLVDRIPAGGGEVLPGFTVEPTPGHSVDHTSILLASGGREALLSGDILHHPVQLRRPQWCSVFCADQAQARASRETMLDRVVRSGWLFLSSHFSGSSAGYVERSGEAFRWRPISPPTDPVETRPLR